MQTIIHTEEINTQVAADLADDFEYRDRATLHSSPWVDHAGNQFDCFSTLQGNTTTIIVVKSNRLGQELQRWSLPAMPPFKIDDFGVFQSGADLLFLVAAHEISSDPNRRNIVYRDSLPGICIPYPAGQMPVGAETEYISREPNPQPIEFDYVRIVREVLTALKADMNGELGAQVQQRAKNGARQGIQTEYSGGALYNDSGLYNRLKETVYEVLRDQHVLDAVEKILKG
jgi:hypothetical protein